MSNEQIGGELIGQGSFGCVFNPSIKCPGEKQSKMDVVSKVFFNKDGKKELGNEFQINKMIKAIRGHDEWAKIWFKRCKPPVYDKLYKQDPSIKECLEDNHVTIQDFNKIRAMLQGDYGGEDFLHYMFRQFPKSVLKSGPRFKTNFLEVMKTMKPLFLGLKEMYINGVGHNDIKELNIVVDGHSCKFIDFGYACSVRDDKSYRKRSSIELLTNRIYPAYPYEFIYLYSTIDLLEEELDELDVDIYRSLHSRYEQVHKMCFGREVDINLRNLLSRYISGHNTKDTIKPINKYKLLSLLDTYSLGMVFPSVLYKIAKKHRALKQIRKLISMPVIKSFIYLFKNMTEPDYFNRMKPTDAYDKYLEL